MQVIPDRRRRCRACDRRAGKPILLADLSRAQHLVHLCSAEFDGAVVITIFRRRAASDSAVCLDRFRYGIRKQDCFLRVVENCIAGSRG
nr:MAG TPA: hypothetical protein [Caudoviricetes sp.]